MARKKLKIMSPIISVSGLSKIYDGGFEALKDLSLDIDTGEIIAIGTERGWQDNIDFDDLRAGIYKHRHGAGWRI